MKQCANVPMKQCANIFIFRQIHASTNAEGRSGKSVLAWRDCFCRGFGSFLQYLPKQNDNEKYHSIVFTSV